MISRRILPSRTAASAAAMTSRCQFGANSACGLRSAKQRATKVAKSSRNAASYWASVRSSIIGLSFVAIEPSLQLFDDFLIRRGEGGVAGRGWFGLAFGVAKQIEQDLHRAPIALGRLVDELLDDRLAHRALPAPAILGDGDGFVERFTEQGRYVLRSPRPAPRIAGLAFLKLGVSMSLRLSNRVHGRRAKPDLPARRLCRDLERLSILYGRRGGRH